MPASTADAAYQRDVYTVSRLNSEVRAVLEGSFPLLWVEGEISNLACPSSGHIYFSLKDPHAQVRCAMFRMKRLQLRFQPANGMQVLVRARVGLYEGRGDFQLVVEHMEPAGEGALRQAFEALKAALAAEGLFDAAHKRPLPALPRRIGVITSPTGAAIRDVLTVLGRRFPAIPVLIYPVPVQGAGAAEEIAGMLRLADRRRECDLLILTRGGGSLEDLMAFNDERVARAIHALEIPLISAIGHEIDFTIADFVADRRAPTPSAAAEMASPDRIELGERIDALAYRLLLQTRQLHSRLQHGLKSLADRLQRCHPGIILRQQSQGLDDLERRLGYAMTLKVHRSAERLNALEGRLRLLTPARRLEQGRQAVGALAQRLEGALRTSLRHRRERLAGTAGRLDALSPLATLQRGYSITRRLPDGAVVTDAAPLRPGDRVESLLARGRLVSRVESVEPQEE